MTTDFSSLILTTELIKNLASLGYKNMTPIQAQSLPEILHGRDLIAQAKTGSGKTAAFGLGLLHKLEAYHFAVQALVLCPTRELSEQVAVELRKLARATPNVKILTLCGGMPFSAQLSSLKHGAHIIVGTAGRIEEHLRKETLDLSQVTSFVLDEADRMLDMGFEPAINNILPYLPKKRQTLLFSATYPDEIETIAQRIMQEPVMVQLTDLHSEDTIAQSFYEVSDGQERTTLLFLLLQKYKPESALIFCNTKRETQAIVEELEEAGFSATAMHGDLDQKEREQALVCFANKSISILVATDVAARGLDIEQLDAVINYEIPRELEVYVHRIGRTGRAGEKGLACTLIGKNEDYKVEALENYLGKTIQYTKSPSLALLKKPGFKSSMATLRIDGGKQKKLRPGDILGALTNGVDIKGDQVGKINLFDRVAFVAVDRAVAKVALKKITEEKMKGRKFRVRRIT